MALERKPTLAADLTPIARDCSTQNRLAPEIGEGVGKGKILYAKPGFNGQWVRQ